MDWSKVDAGLASALTEDRRSERFVVFVHLAGEAAPEELATAGLSPEDRGAIRTADLAVDVIERLTDQPWVRRIELARPVRLADGG